MTFLAANPLIGSDMTYRAEGFDRRLKEIYIPSVELIAACHVCGGQDFAKLKYPPNYRPTEKVFLANPAISQDLSRCETCGLILARNALAPDFYFDYLNTGYSNASFPKSPQAIEAAEANYRIKHRFAWQHVKPEGRVLEVSSFWGTGLNDIADHCDVWGLEAENAAARFSVEHYPKLRRRIINDVVENGFDQLRKVGPFDRILISYAFRHMPRPRLVLEWLRDVSAPGGYVLMTEGTWSDYIFWEPRPAQALHFFHNKANYFNLLNLDRLMSAYGFRLVRSDMRMRDKDVSFDQSVAIFRRDPERKPITGPHAESKALSASIWQEFIRAQP